VTDLQPGDLADLEPGETDTQPGDRPGPPPDDDAPGQSPRGSPAAK
jgi:hypothetical protein